MFDKKTKETKTIFTIAKETKEYIAKAVYKDGDKVIGIEGESLTVRVIMNYLTSQTAQKLESIPLMYPIDEAFTVSVKISGDNNWKEVTTSSDIATLGEDRNTVTFKEAGTFSLRVSIGERILTEEYVTVESSV